MNSKPKIIVLRMREIVYTVFLGLLVILLLLCLFLMFSPGQSGGGGQTGSTERQTAQTDETAADTGKQSETLPQITEQREADTAGQPDTAVQTGAAGISGTKSAAAVSSSMVFTPGVYTVPIFLNDAAADVEVTVDADHINAIRLVNLNEAVETMYPLMTPALENLTSQILQRQTTDGITCPQESRYTSQLLLNAISDALDIAAAD